MSRPAKIQPIECAPDCDHWLYAEEDSEGLISNEGSDDGDDY